LRGGDHRGLESRWPLDYTILTAPTWLGPELCPLFETRPICRAVNERPL